MVVKNFTHFQPLQHVLSYILYYRFVRFVSRIFIYGFKVCWVCLDFVYFCKKKEKKLAALFPYDYLKRLNLLIHIFHQFKKKNIILLSTIPNKSNFSFWLSIPHLRYFIVSQSIFYSMISTFNWILQFDVVLYTYAYNLWFWKQQVWPKRMEIYRNFTNTPV